MASMPLPSTTSRRAAATSKATVLFAALGGAAVVLVSATQAWVHGTVTDTVLGTMPAQGTGSQVAPTAVAGALVAGAAAVVSGTSGAVVRRVAAMGMLLGALLCAVAVAAVAADPGGALRRASSTALGRRDTLHAIAQTGPWLWVAGAAALLVATAALCGVAGAGRWRALSSRYDAPSERPASVARSVYRPPTPWDRLSQGGDPTDDPTLSGPDADGR